MSEEPSKDDEEDYVVVFQCPECGKELHDDVDECPYCGVVFADSGEEEEEDLLSLEDEIEGLLSDIETRSKESKKSGEDEDDLSWLDEDDEQELDEDLFKDDEEEDTEELDLDEEIFGEGPSSDEISDDESDEDIDEELIEEELEKELRELETELSAEELKEEGIITEEDFFEEELGLEEEPEELEEEILKEPVESGEISEPDEGRTNGEVREEHKEKEEGFVNGMTNGLTNGMTNGLGKEKDKESSSFINGMVNGVGRKRDKIEKKVGSRKIFATAVAIILLIGILGVGYFLYSPSTVEEGIVIDGNFDDWSGVDRYSMSFEGVSGSVTVQESAVSLSESRVDFYIRTEEDILTGGPDRSMDSMYFFLNSQGSGSELYRTPTIEASHMIKLKGWNQEVTGEIFTYTNSSDGLNWNSWEKVGAVSIEKSGDQVEFSMPRNYLGGEDIQSYIVSKDYEGNLFKNDYVVVPGKPALSVYQYAPEKGVIGDDEKVLGLVLKAHNDDVVVDSLDYRGEDDFSSISYGNGDPFPIELGRGDRRELVINGVPSTDPGDTVGLNVIGVDSEAVVTITGKGGNYYYQDVPNGTNIDGAFADWDDADYDPSDMIPKRVDIRAFSSNMEGDENMFYMEVGGEIFSGTPVPEKVQKYREKKVDTDRDTVPDEEDPYPNDFNNDGVDDSNSLIGQFSDVDGDGVADAPVGDDTVLNTTIPNGQNFPEKYRGKDVNIWIGERGAVPRVSGEDQVVVYLDSDNDTSTGQRISDIGADWKVVFKGLYGEVTEKDVCMYDDGWISGASVPPKAAVGLRELEFQTDITMDDYRVIFETKDWNETGDQCRANMYEDRHKTKIKTKSSLKEQLTSHTLSSSLTELVSGTGASSSEDGFGWNISYAGDINNDGYDDVLIGAPYNDGGGTDSGAAYVYFGYAGVHRHDINAANANVTITGSSSADLFGWDLAGGVDVNNNGNPDVVIGAPGKMGNSKTGKVYVFYDTTLTEGASLDAETDADDIISGSSVDDKFGASVSAAGDVDGDGNDDFVVGAWNADVESGTVEENILAEDFEGDGTPSYAELGWTTIENGNVDADHWKLTTSPTSGTDHGSWQNDVDSDAGGSVEHDEWLISPVIDFSDYTDCTLEFWHSYSRFEETSSEGAYVDISLDGGSTWPHNVMHYYAEDHLDTRESFDISSYVDGESNVKIRWRYIANYDWWWEMDDVYINGTTSTYESLGSSYVFNSDGSLPTSASSSDDILTGSSAGDRFGFSVAHGDVDNDNYDDILVGAPGEERAYIYYGPGLNKETALTTTNTNERFGWDVTGIGNYLGTSGDSVAVSAPWSTYGTVYIYSAEDITSTDGNILDETYSDFTETGSSLDTVNPNNGVYATSDGFLNLTENMYIDDDFEDGDLTGWTISEGRSTSITNSNDYGNSGTQSVLLDDYGTHGTQDDSGYIYHQITDHLESGVSEVWVRTTTDSDPFRFFLLNYDATNPETTLIIFTEGNIKAYDGDGAGSGSALNVASYSADTWYHIKVEFDSLNDEYDIYIDDMDQPAMENLGYLYNRDSSYEYVDTMYFSSLDGSTSTTYFDDAKLYDYSGVGYYDSPITTITDNINSVKYLWNVTEPSGSNIWVDISRDGGNTWNQSSLVENTWYSFNNGEPIGNDLCYKITMRSNGLTPELDDIKIIYSSLSHTASIEGETMWDGFGYSMDSGDFDGDSTSDLYVGAKNASIFTSAQLTDSYAVDYDQYLSQSFVALQNETLNSFSMAAYDAGTDSTSMDLSIREDNGGEPSSTALSSVESVDFSSLGEWKEITFTTAPDLTKGETYWIVAENSDTADNGYRWYYQNYNAYRNGNIAYNPIATGEWTNHTASDLLFYTNINYGASYVFLGGNDPGYTNATIADYANYGTQEDQNYGWSVCHVGYMNGDTFAEMGSSGAYYGYNDFQGMTDILTAQIPEFSSIMIPVLFIAAIPIIYWRKREH